MLLIYSEKISPRFRYISKLLFSDLLGLELQFTSEKEEYLGFEGPRINYSRTPLQEGIYLQASSILMETEIFEQEFQHTEFQSEVVFFLSGKQSQLPFDPLAASFYLVSRYEEYLPFIADEHNRFPARESVQYKLKTMDRPLVNAYAEILAGLLTEHYPGITFKRPEYSFVCSVDIDNAYAYLGKGIFRTAGAYLKDLVSLDFREMLTRTQTIFGMRKDPFETFDFQYELQEKYKYQTIYFALFARLAQYDRSLTLHSPRLQRYLKGINDFCDVGIHPSYRSNGSGRIAEEEMRALESVLKRDITKSRQHFLKLKFPETYRNLIDMEITDDYSMGFAAETGFRAGICTPFRFYDLELEVETQLTVHPFPFMDGTFIYYQEKGAEEALKEILHYIDIYRQFGGEFIPVWHNRVFSEKEEEWTSWNHTFEEMIKAAV